jgi:hypothetical protein
MALPSLSWILFSPHGYVTIRLIDTLAGGCPSILSKQYFQSRSRTAYFIHGEFAPTYKEVTMSRL